MNSTRGSKKFFYGWIVIAITFAALLVSSGIRSMPSILIEPLENEFGWSRSGISSVVSVGIFLYGLTGPFSAAFLLKYGIRRTIVYALAALAASILVTPLMTSLWQFELLWGLLGGIATGLMANVLGITVTNLWFVKHRGLVLGMLTASAATGQLLFLPLLAKITVDSGWRTAMYASAGFIVALLVIVALWMRNRPSDVGAAPYGADRIEPPTPFKGNIFLAPLQTLGEAVRHPTFWLLAGTFFFCGYSTNGLIGTHLIAACGDFGISEVVAASFLALMGLFDLVGTTASGWLSDRFDSRWLLFWYYGLRGLSLVFLPYALHLGYTEMTIFTVFYGLDWIATVPPTVKLSSNAFGKEKAGMVFGWIVVAHQIGASVAAYGAGAMREWFGSYTVPFVSAGFVCFFASVMAVRVAKERSFAQAMKA
ncbi:MFS transporter [Cohnella zeiphila]|uniref:MFS transporter n=1 Tax=Cohnella zeiphila TaxID=2761120 RepID=A0A7X0VVC0_9BACL|nr:MFS transporter [Cohnella zeiphila]MBB6731826.1 MFS transporter [Cohnella zeiphila]